ncbi:NAD-binding protein [Fimbriiglobus ruber]|uniref:Putative secreted protein n=1 Tax=Fimbriiglobus ruber TaxID=1908690 RepID=A0A225DLA8_9BACT|nr:NAD-binding protein [Fimbriiglobus ruber]OWK37969.1 putative secreted protein [Fimbriiglobus ruber]
MSKPTLPRVAILGAGPIGLEAALYAKSLGHPVTVYEANAPGAHVERWGFLRMFTPFGMNVTPLGLAALLRDAPDRELPADTDLITGKEFRDAYLAPLAESSALRGLVQPQTRVVAIGRAGWRKGEPADPKKPLPPFRLLVRDPRGVERFDAADVVLDCTGTLGRPNWVGDGGIPAVGEVAARQHAAYWPEDVRGARTGHYAGKSVLVIGAGYSAATAVCELATLAEVHQATWVIWLTNGPRTQPLGRIGGDPLKERDRLAARANSLAMRCDGNLEYHPQAMIDELVCGGPDQGFRVAARLAGKPTTWDVERVIANVGYRPDLSACAELRVGEPAGRVETDEPGYFILGAKAKGRDSNFLIQDGHAHVRRTFAVVAGKPGLDLYAKKAA